MRFSVLLILFLVPALAYCSGSYDFVYEQHGREKASRSIGSGVFSYDRNVTIRKQVTVVLREGGECVDSLKAAEGVESVSTRRGYVIRRALSRYFYALGLVSLYLLAVVLLLVAIMNIHEERLRRGSLDKEEFDLP